MVFLRRIRKSTPKAAALRAVLSLSKMPPMVDMQSFGRLWAAFFLNNLLKYTLEFLESEVETLFNCISVNRTWCRTAIPVLWGAAFETPKDFWYRNTRSRLKFAMTCVACLDDAERTQMTAATKLPIAAPEKRPLFDYLSFARVLDGHTVWKIAHSLVSAGNLKHSIYAEDGCCVLTRILLSHGIRLRELKPVAYEDYQYLVENLHLVNKLAIRSATFFFIFEGPNKLSDPKIRADLCAWIPQILEALAHLERLSLTHDRQIPASISHALFTHAPTRVRMLACSEMYFDVALISDCVQRSTSLKELRVQCRQWTLRGQDEMVLKNQLASMGKWSFNQGADHFIVGKRLA
jgi:hypothetical protein